MRVEYKMATSEDEVECRLEKNKKKIEYIQYGRKVVDRVWCGKCLEDFHPSSLGLAANRKDAICRKIIYKLKGCRLNRQLHMIIDHTTQNH